ncbi:putative receptor-like protein kinase [Dorcoceras hygrometricum]|uniref:Putative receptor-like protein kinase n=1 Tax=Dorcoceras hygrometricum TaxID=472368 RepID=A0A2Z7C3H9_9LAMI|nr:putative receptor-like protein kinase [Dorcoceras hygrometricum]
MFIKPFSGRLPSISAVVWGKTGGAELVLISSFDCYQFGVVDRRVRGAWGTTHQSASHNVAFNQVLQVYIGINNKGKAQNQEELLPRSSKLTDEQPDQISQESSNEQQLCASSSSRSTASNKVAIERGTLKEPIAT